MSATLADKVRTSMVVKFVAALSSVIIILMIVGTLFVSRLLLEKRYEEKTAQGRESARFVGMVVADSILMQNFLAIETVVEQVVRAPEVLYAYVVDTSGTVLTSTAASFSQSRPEVQSAAKADPKGDVAALARRLKEQEDVLEVAADINLQGSSLGTVVMGYSRTELRQEAFRVVVLLFSTGIGITVLLALLVSTMARRMVVLPTLETVAVASKIAAGDLTRSVRVRSNDEIGALGRGLNTMVVGLKDMVMRVRDSAQSVSAVSGQVQGIAERVTQGSRDQAESVEEAGSSVNEMHFSLKEISRNVDDVFKHSEHTSSSVLEMAASIDEVARTMADLSNSIEETSTAITQMSAAVRQIAENVELLSTAAEETAASANEITASVREVEANAKESAALADGVLDDARGLGMRSIEKTIEGMSRIESAALRTAEVVNRLRERSDSIGTIVTVIEDITDQTGLLALNASILAAQAGEHGKGFAVVAAEIRELANRTASSTQEIAKLIASVQEESRDAVTVMNEGAALVAQGTALSREAGDALTKIVERAARSREMSASISKASAEQARGIRQVSEAVEKINEMTHQIARATSEQKSGSGQIMRAAERMREITRFVKSASAEQAKGGKDITAAVESMNAKIGMVNRAATEVQAGSDLIVKAIEKIKAIARMNADLATGLANAVQVMAGQSTTLNSEIEKFKTAASGITGPAA
jgi:methyl-accepting chemotaxis protein